MLTTELTLSQAVANLTALESEQEQVTTESKALRARLSELDAGAFDRMDAMGAAHREVVAAAKREWS